MFVAWTGATTCGDTCIPSTILAADGLALGIAGEWFRCDELIESSLCSVQYAPGGNVGHEAGG